MAERKRNCPSAETLYAYVDGALRKRERIRLLRHVEGCSECAGAVEEAARLQQFGDRVRRECADADEAPPTDHWTNVVLAALREKGPSSER